MACTLFLKTLAFSVALTAATRQVASRGLQQQQQQQQQLQKPTPAPTTTLSPPVPSFTPVSDPPKNWYVAAEAPDYNNAVHAEFLQTIKHVRGKGERYAVFDWDNTCMYGDISYTSVFYQMDNLEYRIQPEQFERTFALGYTASNGDECLPLGVNSVLGTDVNGANVTLARALAATAADYRVLYDAYIAPTHNLSARANRSTAVALTLAQARATAAFQNFRAKLAFLTFGLEASYGAKDRLPCAMRIGMTVFPQLLVGMTDAEIRALIRASVRWNLGAQLAAPSFTSSGDLAVKGDYSTGLRVFNGQETAMRSLRAFDTDVYIISASPQVFVEEVGRLLGLGFLVPSTNVFAVRFAFDGGAFSGRLVADYPITWGPGKAAIVEKVLKPRYRNKAPVYASGDSDGDCDMLATVRDGIVHVNNRLKDASTCIQAFYELSCRFFLAQEPATKNKYLLQGQDKALGSWIPSGFSTKDGVSYKSSAAANNACAAYKFLQ
ncbi:hypothetical protein PybrP1_010582 [[Pythium] brassicae (nom. inval.)]|nr:hypothetical protein PybrP1_010582 [[Pythium] brassicae (nom. inval.)]